ncbi:MAG TPA: FAD-dependent oxidoreductase [Bryobacteraceae bacterium]|nr:FAD-dependent oxidoreductase [Bryobacteraceae bacterium]
MKARLIRSREIAPNTRHFEFESPEWKAAFVPGQFLSLTREGVTRAYSIASPPDSNSFALCANLVQEGHFSPFLFAMQPGDEIDFKGPYGAFIMKRDVSDSIFVATGTGIAPFRSMLMAGLNRPVTLIFGVRHREGLLYDEELRTMPIDYRPTLTRPAAGWTGLTGRVQSHVLRALGERRDVDIYICGLREMVDELRANLKEIGLDRKRIVYEKYD